MEFLKASVIMNMINVKTWIQENNKGMSMERKK
jgi:hypothetical protein